MTLFLHLEGIPSTESHPFEIFVDEKLVYTDSSNDTKAKDVELTIDEPKIAKKHIIQLRIKINAKGINSVQPFNLTDDGNLITLKRPPTGGLEIKQAFPK